MQFTTALLATTIALGLAGSVHAASVTINGPHASLPCSTCHQGDQMTAPAKETCLTCHESYAKVAERTKSMTSNPHASHRGEPNCTNCHSLHGKSRFECNDCHTFNIQMKGE